MYVLKEYLKRHKKSISLFLIYMSTFFVIFFLCSFPLNDFLYGVTICLFFSAIFVLIDFSQYYHKHKLLQQLRNQITVSLDGLPLPKDIIEEDYSTLLTMSFEDKMRVLSNSDNEQMDMLNYYTMWVHQIKTPIAAMRLLLQTSQFENQSALEAELFKIEQYVEMVLSYARLGSDSTDYRIQEYELDSIIKQAVRKYAKLFIQSKIRLEFIETNAKVITDEKWLLFVIEQVLSNALKYTHKGTITICANDSKTLLIQDTGIGIAKEDIPRVFEKGFTGYNGRSDKKSTGIGLYLCRCILKKLGHSINITSEVGIGTTVAIYLDSLPVSIE